MFSTRKTWWASLTAVALVAGCAAETTEPAEPTDAASNPAVAPGPAPETPPAASPDATPSEAAPAPAPANPDAAKPDDAAAPKVDVPTIEAPKIEAPKSEPAKEEPKAAAAGVNLSEEEVAEIKKLPEAEQAAALKQAVCPVSEENLGSMGTPIKVTAEGKTFYLCCKGCKKDVDADPKAVVAKLTGK